LSIADIVILVFLGIAAYQGYKQGFLMSLFSLLGMILGIFAGFKLMGEAMIFLSKRFNVDEEVLPYLAFALVFVLVVLGVTLLGKSLRASIDQSFLGKVDQVAGSVLGVLKGAFIWSVIIWLVESLEFQLPEHWTEDSVIVHHVAQIAPSSAAWLAQFIPAVGDLFS